MYTTQTAAPTAQTTGFVCPICDQPLGLELPHEHWEIMASNNAFGHLWNTMLPLGLVFGRFRQRSATQFEIEPIPKYIHLDEVQRFYTPMHSRCYRAKRQEWVQQQQAQCEHERWTYQAWCPDCRLRQR